MRTKGISAKELLSFIPNEELERIGEENKVDYQVKRLYGKTVFQLLLYGLLSAKELSFRVLEALFESAGFQQFSGPTDDRRTDHSSIADRIGAIKLGFFKEIFGHVSKQLSEAFTPAELGRYKIVRVDSTVISLSSKLLKTQGMRNGEPSKRKDSEQLNVKFSIGFDGMVAHSARFSNQQSYVSENLALKALIMENAPAANEVVVFDQGINSRKTFGEMSGMGMRFVTRTRLKTRHKKVGEVTAIPTEQPIETATLKIMHDELVHLYDEDMKKTKYTLRLIKAKMKKNGEEIWVLSNMMELTAEEITDIYYKRWDIEVFFKFIKQEFGFRHFLSRNENGLQVMMYMTLIAAMLVYIYRKKNKIESFKIAKLRLVNELEKEFIRTIIELCQGNPDLLDFIHQYRL